MEKCLLCGGPLDDSDDECFYDQICTDCEEGGRDVSRMVWANYREKDDYHE